MAKILSISTIISAILLSQPKMAPSTARGYASVVRQEATEHGFDPLTLVAMAHYESQWLAGSHNATCFGLVGVCHGTFSACRADPASEACGAVRARLLDGRENLRVAASMIEANRRFCKRKTGHARERHWLPSYQGLNRGGIWCGQRKVRGRWQDVPMHRITRRVLERKRLLQRKARP